ncbi:serine/threonine-protein kinase ULK3-like isoform X2 [Pollicipes pollicipes]|uniref:serine/threonine-protein kinase ULK3-like isoform X2 n=1 Tax=Pollicipes pollicipes TaxID=41117 RepID=UPI0018850D82|nr:serine/threonine-protein kinase ULK3-like isoform X2 [Pollicipes pollicipes]
MAAAAPSASTPTPALDGYQLLEQVGSGTYADVYRAVRRSDRRQVALKCVHRARLNRRATDNIVSEIGLLKRLEHPNVVRLYDFGCDRHYVYIVMELCAGGDLSRLIRARRRLPESVCRQFLRQLSLAMQYLHSRGISHMDLKPQNLLLTTDTPPTLKVADFGFAKYLASDDRTEGLRGSPLYMAPEIVTERQYSASADLWSIGVILYECLFGKAPYSSNSIKELIDKMKVDKPVQLPPAVSVSDECRDLLTRLLQRDPQRRIIFEHFFEHPFVDLEHAPSADSLPKGTRLVEQAVEKDAAGELEAAVQLYRDGLEHLLAAVQYEQSEERRAALRRRLEEYVRRVEALRGRLHPPASPQSGPMPGAAADPDTAALEALTPQRESVRSALEMARSAVWYERETRWDTALETYQLAIQQLMTRARQAEPEERRLLTAVVERWLSRAEAIQSMRDLQKGMASSGGADDGSHKKCTVQ